MRHFIESRLPSPPRPLSRRMLVRPAPAALIARTRPAQRCAAPRLSAAFRAVHLTVIALAADRHWLAAAPAPIVPIGFLTHRAPRSTQQWTNSGSARITSARIALLTHRTQGPRSDRQILPRAFFSFTALKHSQSHRSRPFGVSNFYRGKAATAAIGSRHLQVDFFW